MLNDSPVVAELVSDVRLLTRTFLFQITQQ